MTYSFKEALSEIQEDLKTLEKKSGRLPNSVQLMAVSKNQGQDRVLEALAAGCTLFGENRVQEAQEKFNGLNNNNFDLHFIGRLQKNKIKKAVRLFSCVQSVYDEETLILLAKESDVLGKTLDILFEVNVSGELSKGGVTSADQLLFLIDHGLQLGALRLRGLMTIGPNTDDELKIRKSFSELKVLFDTCKQKYGLNSWDVLSMGMSGDYRWAIEEGSTLIRVGTKLFGTRQL